MADEIGIDLGTSSTRIYVANKKAVVFDEPTCLAVEKDTKAIRNIGYLAFKSLGRAPYGVEVEFPVKDGVIADVELVARFVEQVFSNLGKRKLLRNARFFVAAPNQMTKVEKNALVEVFKKLGAREIVLMPSAKAAAIGAGFDPESPSGTLVLDVGGGVSDCGALSMGEIVVAHSTKVGGKAFDHAVDRFVKTSKNLDVGFRAAEQVKMRIGSVDPKAENQFCEVSGRNIANGLPSTAVISTAELVPLFRPLLEEIEENVREVIQDIPAEMVGDIVRAGILLSGGGSQLAGMKEALEGDLKVPVHPVSDPAHAGIIGLAKTIEG